MEGIFPPGFEEELLETIKIQYRLDWNGIHGVRHWQRVQANAIFLSASCQVDARLGVLFALLHDSQRHNDGCDFLHGKRAAIYLSTLQPVTSILTPEELKMLEFACEFHTSGRTEAELPVQICWDSDRLDLGRVGIRPNPRRLCTAAARQPDVIARAYNQSQGQ